MVFTWFCRSPGTIAELKPRSVILETPIPLACFGESFASWYFKTPWPGSSWSNCSATSLQPVAPAGSAAPRSRPPAPLETLSSLLGTALPAAPAPRSLEPKATLSRTPHRTDNDPRAKPSAPYNQIRLQTIGKTSGVKQCAVQNLLFLRLFAWLSPRDVPARPSDHRHYPPPGSVPPEELV